VTKFWVYNSHSATVAKFYTSVVATKSQWQSSEHTVVIQSQWQSSEHTVVIQSQWQSSVQMNKPLNHSGKILNIQCSFVEATCTVSVEKL
jgi:hypothetical protein